MVTQLHKATLSDKPWVDSIYTKIQFMPSDFSKEYIAIAYINGEKVGLGRLVQIEDVLELGGMYVDEGYRGKGIAKAIVQHLLAQAPQGKLVYCIPFAHLEVFYKSFGFVNAPVQENLPQEIKTKMGFCGKTYNTKVSLLQLLK